MPETDEQAKQAWITSLRLLTATPKTRKELEKKLSDKGYSESVISKTLSGLEEKGLLSDLAYAKNLASRMTHEKPSGRRKISFEMKRRGVPGAIQEEVLGSISTEDELLKAREIAAYKWAQTQKLEPEKRKRKIYDFLIRRGFDFQITREIVEELEIQSHEN